MLTHFQEIAALALDLSDQKALLIRSDWPDSKEKLLRCLKAWKTATQSQLTGLTILTACDAIWKHKPADLSEQQGREILYHPATGQVIEKNSLFDKVSWEILAFLRWSLMKSYLSWSDEVAIKRDIDLTNGNIDDLPADRFYAKYALVRHGDGTIDWSDLELAQAKAFVMQGPDKIESEIKPNNPVYIDNSSLEGVLAGIPALHDEAGRNMLLRGFPNNLVGSIPRSRSYSTDLYNIVVAVEGWGKLSNGKMAINVLIENALHFCRGTQKEHELREFIK